MTRLTWQLVGLLGVAFTACGGGASTGSNASGTRTSPAASTTASYARTQPGSPPPGAMAGTISGALGYPSEFLPAQAVYAIATDGTRFYRVESVVGQQHYKMVGVPAGDYFVLTVTRMPVRLGSGDAPANARFGAGYTKSVLCGLSVDCLDHSLVSVHVSAGRDTPNIDPGDWYVPENAYPIVPGGGPQLLRLDAQPVAFPNFHDAAVDVAQARTGGRYVKQAQDCPANAACTWFVSSRVGQGSAYYTGFAGSNTDLQACGFYVFGAGTAWQAFTAQCRSGTDPFPAVGSTGHVRLGMGETDCVNVRAAAGKTAKVVGCLASGTQVRIDDGPVYVTPAAGTSPSSLDLWWHIAGRGWMVDQYLRD